MKKFTILIVMIFIGVTALFAQAPEKFNYQAVVRNASNALVTNAPVGVRVSILQGSASGNAVYVETHTASTNANGLLTLEIGGGAVQQGSFAGINWANGPFFLKTETDPAGGSNYTVTSTQQLMSVPYALYAEEAANGFSGDYNDLTNKPTIPQNVSDLTNNAGYITANDIPAQVNADWDATGGPAEILNKPVNADFGQGVVRNKVNNPSGETDIAVNFSTYQLVNGGVVSLVFTRAVPAGATLNINSMGAKPIYYHESPLAAGVIKANDRCLFMYNGPGERYYLIAIDRWGVDLNALATVAHTGSYNDLTDKPTIPTVPTNISAFVNDAGYITAIPDSFGGISLESDPIFSAWNKDYNDLINKPTNATFGQGIVRNNVNNAAGATDIAVTFSTYELVSGGVVSLSFTRNVPAGATLNINNKGAKPILYRGTALPAGTIKANDRCLFMYNSGADSYILIAIDRWGTDLNALATVATSGSYNDLTNKPNIPTSVSQLTNDAGYVTTADIPAQTNADWNATSGAAQILHKPNLAPVATSGSYNDLTNQPTNADFGQGVVRNKVNNPSGETDIDVNFSTYQLVNGGVVSLVFTRAVPAGATLNINDKGAKPIYYHESPLPAGLIKANDRCLFMYNGPGERYYLIAIDRWGADLNALATVATSGSYNDLTNKPTIPTSVSQLTNDAGYITAAEVPVQVNADWNATSGAAQILHKPNLAPVATSGSYNDLTNKPNIPTSVSQLTNDAGYVTAAEVPAQVNADWNATSGAAQILHKPNLAPVATSGDYNDLNNKPTIPTVPTNISAFVNDAGYLTAIPDGMGGISVEADPIFSAWDKDYNDLTNKPNLAIVATTGNYNDLVNKPLLFSGNYNDLTNKPTIPTVPNNVSAFLNDVHYITQQQLAYIIDSLHSDYSQKIDSLTNIISSMNAIAMPCGTYPVVDFDGNIYATVSIGTQCWLKQNLRTTRYSDGEPIAAGGVGTGNWTSSGTIAYWYFPTESNIASHVDGYLYNRKAIIRDATLSSNVPENIQGPCPNGWHVPSESEWNILVDFVSSNNQYTCSGGAAKALSSSSGWNTNNNVCAPGSTSGGEKANRTGFSALPSGYVYPSNSGSSWGFQEYGDAALFYTSTLTSGSSDTLPFKVFRIKSTSSLTQIVGSYTSRCYSVRCLRD